MRKLLNVSLLLTVLFLAACEKQETESLISNEKTTTIAVDGVSVKDGILCFNSSKDLYEITESLSAMNHDEKVAWEKSLGFVSLEREIEFVNEEISSIESEDEYRKIASDNSDILKLDDGVLEPIISSIFYSMIVNRNGFFIVNGILHKVTEKGVYTDDNCSFEEIDLVAKGLTTNENVGFVSKNELHLKSGECGADDDEESNWHDSRKCNAKILVERPYCKDDCCTHSWWYTVTAYSTSVASTLGVHYQYESFHNCTGLEVRITVPIVSSYNGQISTFSYSEIVVNDDIDNPTSDEKTHYWWKSKAIGDRVQIWNSTTKPTPPIPNPAMTQVKGTFWTRGSYPEMAVIDCGYGY